MGAPAIRGAVVLLLLSLTLRPTGALADGAEVFKAHCALCHGDGVAPRFVGRSIDEVKAALTFGKGGMAPLPVSAR